MNLFNDKKTPQNKNTKENIEKNKQMERENNLKIESLVSNWQNTFGNLKHWNQERNGYTLDNIKVTDYGLSCRIYAPWGINLFDLNKYTEIIESGCKCEFLYTIPQHRQFAMAKFIYPEQVKINDWEFKPIKVQPWEFCCGYDVSGEPVKFNINHTPHILIGGQQRKGKNACLDHAIINWIYSCNETEIQFYMFQCAKNDLIKFKQCKQTYCYATTLEDTLLALEHLDKEMDKRTQLFEPMVSKADGNDNIFHYNKLHPSNKLPYIIVIIDEFIELIPDNIADDKPMKEVKNKILRYLRRIGQWGGSLGINYCPLSQKASRDLMPPFLKNQSSIRICFGFDDLVCAAIIIGDELAKHAHKLPPRKAYFSNNEYNGYLYTSNLEGRINLFIKDSIKPNHRTLFDDLKKLNSKLDIKINKVDSENIDVPINMPVNLSQEKPIPIPNINININKPNTSASQTKENKQEQIPTTNIEITTDIPEVPLEFNKVDPIRIQIDQEKIKETLSRIPNFVPYNPNSKPQVVIDKTQIDFSKTQKPIKNKEVK